MILVLTETWDQDEQSSRGVLDQAMRELEPIIRAMSRKEGVWQQPWLALPTSIPAAMRSRIWARKRLDWPVGERLTNLGYRDIMRIYELITAIEADLLDTPLSDVPTDWRCSDEVTRTQC